jgi:hypothetical protein
MKNGSLGVKQQSFTLTGFALIAVRIKYLQEFPTLIKATPCAMKKWLKKGMVSLEGNNLVVFC